MILEFTASSTDVPLTEDSCYKYSFPIDVTELAAMGWEPNDYTIEISIGDNIPGALQYSFSREVSYHVLDDNGDSKDETAIVWINFIPII